MSENFEMPFFNPYWVLGVKSFSDVNTINKQIEKLANWWHPDKSTGQLRVGNLELHGAVDDDEIPFGKYYNWARIEEACKFLAKEGMKEQYDNALREKRLQVIGEEDLDGDYNAQTRPSTQDFQWEDYSWAIKAIEKVDQPVFGILDLIVELNNRAMANPHILKAIDTKRHDQWYGLIHASDDLIVNWEILDSLVNAEGQEWKKTEETKAIIEWIRRLQGQVSAAEVKLSALAETVAAMEAADPDGEEMRALTRQLRIRIWQFVDSALRGPE